MPKGYIIGHVTVHDPDTYAAYAARNDAIFARYGGTYRVRGGASDSVEGQAFKRHVLIEFPDYVTAKAAYCDPDYQENMKIRHATADSMTVLVEGAD